MKKFPSLQNLWNDLVAVIRRFPFESLFATAGTVSLLVLAENSQKGSLYNEYFIRAAWACNLGLALSLAASLYAESRQARLAERIAVRSGACVAASICGLLLDPVNDKTDLLRCFYLAFAAHLLVAFAAFTGKGQINGFWQFNKSLFLRFFTSVLYSAVLFAGLAAALASTDHLFNLRIDGSRYLQLWLLVAGLFNTLFFLAGVPEHVNALDQEQSYPRGLKLFTQYVLIPLTSIYFIILFAYEIKILLLWALPQGYVSTLILGYAVFGMLSLLLVYPIRSNEDNRWISIFSKSFYLLMLPLILLLVLAIWKRIAEYGITESRYILILLSVWLAGITAYYLRAGMYNIKIIPVSLFMLSLVSVYGPQSASGVSVRSQRGRLKAYLEGRTQSRHGNEKEIISIITYLIDKHGLQSLDGIVPGNMENLASHFNKRIRRQTYYSNRWEVQDDAKDSVLVLLKINPDSVYNSAIYKTVSFISQSQYVIDVRNTETVIAFNNNTIGEKDSILFSTGNTSMVLKKAGDNRLSLTDRNRHTVTVFKADSLLKTLIARKNAYTQNAPFSVKAPQHEMTITGQQGEYQFSCRFEELSAGYNSGKAATISYPNYSGYLLISKYRKNSN